MTLQQVTEMPQRFFPADTFHRGFTLIELAVVLFIVMLLLGGLLPTVSSQIEQQKRNETRKQLDEIQQALMGYAIINKRLPCPADPTKASTASGAGLENVSGTNCASINSNNISVGVLPWATLGLKETDAWERRFTYAVTSGGTNSFTSTSSLIALTKTGQLSIMNADSGGNSIASSIPAVILSAGANGAGAYTSAGSPPLAASANADELRNANTSTNYFVSHDFRSDFDDMVVWITPGTLFNRMVAAGQLP